MIDVPIKDASITELNFVTIINSNDPFVMLGIVVSVEINSIPLPANVHQHRSADKLYVLPFFLPANRKNNGTPPQQR